MTTPLQAVMTEIAGGGWGRINGAGQQGGQQASKIAEDRRREAEILAAPFLDEKGQRCLKLLIEKAFFRSDLQPGDPATLEARALYAERREGQKGMVSILLQAIATVRGEPAPKPVGDPT